MDDWPVGGILISENVVCIEGVGQPIAHGQRMTNNQAPSQAPLVTTERLEPWLQHDWQKFWLNIRARPWKSLALVPAGTGGPVDFTLTIAVSLARTGMMHLGVPIRVADATRVPLKQMMQLVSQVNECVSAGDLVLIALGCAKESPITASVAKSADLAVLCVMLESMSTGDAKTTIDLIGAKNFMGSVVFHPDGKPR